MQQQQRERVFTQAYVCETRCLHQRGTVTAACHIEAPEELLLGLCVSLCFPVCDSFSMLVQITRQVCGWGSGGGKMRWL